MKLSVGYHDVQETYLLTGYRIGFLYSAEKRYLLLVHLLFVESLSIFL